MKLKDRGKLGSVKITELMYNGDMSTWKCEW
jgi:hypothetical protein